MSCNLTKQPCHFSYSFHKKVIAKVSGLFFRMRKLRIRFCTVSYLELDEIVSFYFMKTESFSGL